MFGALEKRGGTAKWSDREWYESRVYRGVEGEAYIMVGEEEIRFEMREIIRDEKRLYTEDERRNLPPHKKYKHHYIPTGLFRFDLKADFPDRWIVSWKETAECPMEGFLGEIAATCLLARPALEKQRIAREREARRKRIVAERRAKRRQELDDKRWNAFVAAAEKWDVLRGIRRYLDDLRAGDFDGHERFGKKDTREWLAWAERRLLREEARYARRSLFARLAEMQLEEDVLARRLREFSLNRR